MGTAASIRSERRASLRVPVTLEVTLSRLRGSPISARTLDLGPGGMRAAASRPLRVDEVLTFSFSLTDRDLVGGRARVLREYARQEYALRFEQLEGEAMARVASFVLGLAEAPGRG